MRQWQIYQFIAKFLHTSSGQQATRRVIGKQVGDNTSSKVAHIQLT